jgi:dihydroorotase
MPNTDPLPYEPATVERILRRAHEVGRGVKVMPVGAAVRGKGSSQLSDYAALKDAGAVMISDDGFTIEDETLLTEAFQQCAEVGLPFTGHFELPGDDGLPNEPIAVERACRLAKETGARVHIAHVSTAEGAGIIMEARTDGAPVTWEICPHHFILTAEDVDRLGTLGKVAPRLKTRADADALLTRVIDGDVDALASDHAPHAEPEKAKPFDEAPPGMLGMDCMMSVSHKAIWDRVADPKAWHAARSLWTDGPWSVLGMEGPRIEVGVEARLAIFEFGDAKVRPEWIHSRSSNCPYLDMAVRAKPFMTVLGPRAWLRDSLGRLYPIESEGGWS